MESKHTPGPWALGGTYEDTLLGGNGERVHFVTSPFAGLNQKTENSVANTRLALSAPELLDALELALPELVQLIQDIGGCDHDVNICCCGLFDTVDRVRAAIRKATGREV